MTSIAPLKKPLLDRPGLVLGILLAASLVVRALFLSPGLTDGDSTLYCLAILQRNFIAHPPGYMGYVAIGTFMDWLIGNAYWGLVLISAACHAAILPLTYFLARELGLSIRAALLATAAMAASVNTLFFGGVGLNYIVEGAASAGAALLIFRAVRLKHAGWAIVATFAWSAAGVLRPTTTVFLAPLWIYMLWRVFWPRPRWAAVAACLLLGAVICKSWQYGNNRLLAAANGGVAGNSFVDQAYMGATADYTSMDLNKAAETTQLHTYHWPGVEIVAWVEDHAHIHVMPRPGSTPAPSLGRALKLMATQGSKLGFYILFSAPLLMLLPAAWMAGRKGKTEATPRVDWRLLWVYLAPALLFFITGHFGSFGYLLVILPGMMAASAAVLDAALGQAWARWATGGVLVMSALFFVAGRPLATTNNKGVLANIMALQYTGYGLDQQIGMARASGPPNYQQLPPEVRAARGDEAILKACLFTKAAAAAATAAAAPPPPP